MENLEKTTHIIYTSREIYDNLSEHPSIIYCLYGKGRAHPLEFYEGPIEQANSIINLAQDCAKRGFEIGIEDGITTLNRPKILPAHSLLIGPVSEDELIKFLRAYRTATNKK